MSCASWGSFLLTDNWQGLVYLFVSHQKHHASYFFFLFYANGSLYPISITLHTYGTISEILPYRLFPLTSCSYASWSVRSFFYFAFIHTRYVLWVLSISGCTTDIYFWADNVFTAWSLVFSFVHFYHPCLFSFRMGSKADTRTARKRNGLHRHCLVSFFFVFFMWLRWDWVLDSECTIVCYMLLRWIRARRPVRKLSF